MKRHKFIAMQGDASEFLDVLLVQNTFLESLLALETTQEIAIIELDENGIKIVSGIVRADLGLGGISILTGPALNQTQGLSNATQAFSVISAEELRQLIDDEQAMKATEANRSDSLVASALAKARKSDFQVEGTGDDDDESKL